MQRHRLAGIEIADEAQLLTTSANENASTSGFVGNNLRFASAAISIRAQLTIAGYPVTASSPASSSIHSCVRNAFSHRAMTTVARQLPMTLTHVRAMSI